MVSFLLCTWNVVSGSAAVLDPPVYPFMSTTTEESPSQVCSSPHLGLLQGWTEIGDLGEPFVGILVEKGNTIKLLTMLLKPEQTNSVAILSFLYPASLKEHGFAHPLLGRSFFVLLSSFLNYGPKS